MSSVYSLLQYSFSGATADSKPGLGVMRFNTLTPQNDVTVIRLDNQKFDGTDYSAQIDLFSNLGEIRLWDQFEPSWMTFKVVSVEKKVGYRNVSVTLSGASGADPFIIGNDMLLQFSGPGESFPVQVGGRGAA